ncbi:MAG: sulfite exporter TauE/SafE family protein, partial [Chloroflexi bacterium]|nr:sulfite exporter TauE/SafE family protein [Chloroflexota bacterium]
GGGVVLAPMLVLALGLPPLEAVGATLCTLAVAKFVGAALHDQSRRVDRKVALRLGAAGVPGAVVGALALDRIVALGMYDLNSLASKLVAGALIIVALDMIFRPERKAATEDEATVSTAARGWSPAVYAASFGVGVLTGLSSIGSGLLTGALLLATRRSAVTALPGTLLMCGAVVTAAGAAVHVAAGHVSLPLVGELLLGALPGIVLGTRAPLPFASPEVRRLPASVMPPRGN